MTVFRWLVGVVGALMALGALGSFIVFVLTDIAVWLQRTRRFRRWTWLAFLLWFNVEVWGRVVYTIVNWT